MGLDLEEDLRMREPDRDVVLLGRDAPLVEAFAGTLLRTVLVGAIIGYACMDQML